MQYYCFYGELQYGGWRYCFYAELQYPGTVVGGIVSMQSYSTGTVDGGYSTVQRSSARCA
jgi:hypothetical protein